MDGTKHSASKTKDKAYVKSLLRKRSAKYEPLMKTRQDYYRLRDAYMSLKDDDVTDQVQFARQSDFVSDADLVGRIVNAMRSTRNAIDAYEPVTSGPKAKTSRAAAFLLGLSDLEIQLGAWEILVRIYDAWKGTHSVPLWARWRVKTEAGQHSFERHFNYTLWILRRNKFACFRVFTAQATWLNRLALRPMADLNDIHANIAGGIGPKLAMEQYNYVEWHKTMGVPFNYSARRSWNLDSEVIREALPEIFQTKSRSTKRRLVQEGLQIAPSATKRPRAANVHKSTKPVSSQRNDSAIKKTQRKQAVPVSGAPTSSGAPTFRGFSTQPTHVSSQYTAHSTNNAYPSPSLTVSSFSATPPPGLNQNDLYDRNTLGLAQTGNAGQPANAVAVNPDLQSRSLDQGANNLATLDGMGEVNTSDTLNTAGNFTFDDDFAEFFNFSQYLDFQ